MPFRTGGAGLRRVLASAAIIPVVDGGPRQGDLPEFPTRFASLVNAHTEALDVLNSVPAPVIRHLGRGGSGGPPGARQRHPRDAAGVLAGPCPIGAHGESAG